MKLRVGRRVGRTLYEQQGAEPSDSDPIIGLVDTPQWAAYNLYAVNAVKRLREQHQPRHISEDDIACSHCHGMGAGDTAPYPCPTIQTLEEQ